MSIALPLFTVLTLAFSAMGCLCLAMGRHARKLGIRSRIVQQQGWLSRAGWLLLALGILVSVATKGWGFGLVTLLGFLSVVTLPVTGLMTYRPRWLIYSTATCVPLGLLMAGVLLLGSAIWSGG